MMQPQSVICAGGADDEEDEEDDSPSSSKSAGGSALDSTVEGAKVCSDLFFPVCLSYAVDVSTLPVRHQSLQGHAQPQLLDLDPRTEHGSHHAAKV